MTTLLDRDFPATTSALVDIRAAVQQACRAAHCDEDTAAGWVLAINEACMNVIQHGYAFAEGRALHIEVSCDGDELVTVVCDDGRPVGIDDLKPRAFDELRPGGLGVHFIRELTDTMAYLPPIPGWRNRLRLGRRLNQSAPNLNERA